MTHAIIHNTLNRAHNSFLSGKMRSIMPNQAEFEKSMVAAWEMKENYNKMLQALKNAQRDYKGMALTFNEYGYESSRNEAIETANYLTDLIKEVESKS